MAVTASALHSCSMCFGEKCLRSAIAFEAGRGYWNVLDRKMRFNSFLFSRISKLCSRSKHKFAGKLEDEREITSGQSKLLKKASVFMGYGDLHDFIDNDRAKNEFDMNLERNDDFDLALACKRFPAITLGRSPSVELYDVDNPYKGFLTSHLSAEWFDPDCLETWPPLCPRLPSVSTSIIHGNDSVNAIGTHSASLERKSVKDLPVATEELSSKTVDFESQKALASVVLDKPVNCIPGLTKRQCRQLENCGFHTLRKLLHHFPRTYADLQNAQVGVDDGQYMIFIGKIISSRGVRASYSFSFLEVVVSCKVADPESSSEHITDGDNGGNRTIYLHLKRFFRGARFTFRPFLNSLQEKHKEGDIVCVSGKVKTMPKKNHYEMREYSLDVLHDENDSSVRAKERPYPIYPSKGGLNSNFLSDIISRGLKVLPLNVDPIPKDITQDFGLLCLHDAYSGIHQPKNLSEADLARKRLIFDEFFYLQLGRLFQLLEGLDTEIEKDGLLDKYRKPELNACFMEEWSSLTKRFINSLPYSLTSSQISAVSEIIWDLKRSVPMNRLLQGDVGCGKTVVAFLVCMEVIGAGYQAAFMVPTELLAVQHYEHLVNLLENVEDVQSRPSVALLTGSTPSKQSRLIRQGLQCGDISMVIGTHSLISENVEFSALRITVVDEQHRFGVIQRGRFNSKLYYSPMTSKIDSRNTEDLPNKITSTNFNGSSKTDAYMAPHILAMSATPIPRTLALALYGDMSLTQITDLPPGRLPVETCVVECSETGLDRVYQMMLDELKDGGKVYLVYPVIEQSEQLPQLRAASADLEIISGRFLGYHCGLLHGKMKADEKDEALRRFRSGETRILLSTQVIEVGVDVPDASMMVVMNAERFGMAQLHQLRGRVGRGTRKSNCVLLASTRTSLNRLKVLEKSSDGFYLANMDLLLRGPGDLLGKKQSGHLPEFPIARLEIDGSILQEAHLAALKILGDSHNLEKFPELKAELSMRQPLCLLGD